MKLVTAQRFWGSLVLLILPLIYTPAWAQSQLSPDDHDLAALVLARGQAEEHLGTGDYEGAIGILLQSLRAAPGNRPELADAAYGNGQMISYILLHLMPEPEAYAFAETAFAAETYETDKMVRALCFIAIGLNSEDKTDLTREAHYLTTSNNKLVRAITLYYLSLPYFYTDTDFTQQQAELLAKEFPDLDLTQTALNLRLYAARKSGDFDALASIPDTKDLENPPLKPWSVNLRARIRDSADNLISGEKADSRTDAVRPLLRGITEPPDWRERYFSLLLLKNEFDSTIGPELRQAARMLGDSEANTPDTVLARAELVRTLSADCVASPENTALRDETIALAGAMIEKGVTEPTPERVMWETWVYGLLRCAENLAEAGHVSGAVEIYSSLSRKLPGSKIANLCDSAQADLFHNKPLPIPNEVE